MKLLQRFKHGQNKHPTKSTIPLFSTVIEDRLPAGALLGEQKQPVSETTFYGDQPITLAKDVCIRFRLTPN
ncbi:MAG: hypothetical protein DRR19_10885, partial [Candidatus Parabeggiatoa sp. nov. 1]